MVLGLGLGVQPAALHRRPAVAPPPSGARRCPGRLGCVLRYCCAGCMLLEILLRRGAPDMPWLTAARRRHCVLRYATLRTWLVAMSRKILDELEATG